LKLKKEILDSFERIMETFPIQDLKDVQSPNLVPKKNIDWQKIDSTSLGKYLTEKEIEALSKEDLELVQEFANGFGHLFQFEE
jgi:hypothetical protein